ncbi:hypothetical protein WDU94_006748 [Cyamophila willieti]
MTSTEQSGSTKSWELSMYELNRTPQEAITDNTEIAVSPRSLHSELMCPICLDMLKKTMTTKECLHRFCSDCIITALRSGNKECPTCRKKLVSKRSLRADPNFDLLISKIYPSRDEYEAHQVRVLEKLNKSHSQAAMVQSINEGIKLQSQHRLQRANKKNIQGNEENTPDISNTDQTSSQQQPSPQPTTSNAIKSQLSPVVPKSPEPRPSSAASSSTTKVSKKTAKSDILTSELETDDTSETDDKMSTVESATDGEGHSEDIDEIELKLKPHPDISVNDPVYKTLKKDDLVRLIKTSSTATVDHLTKYLTMRLRLEGSDISDSNFGIYVSPLSNNFILLPGSQSLRQIHDKYWKSEKPLEVYYSWKKV